MRTVLEIIGFLVLACLLVADLNISMDARLDIAEARNEALKIEEARLKSEIFRMGSTVASWYGPGFHGQTTASGQPFDRFALSAAHRTLPLGTVLEITYGQKTIYATVTDRGPYIHGRQLDLSQMAAYRLGFLRDGVVNVQVRVVQ